MIPEDEKDYLMLSGIQHMAFCRRQWALIHLEQQWSENVHTVEGRFFHENADSVTYDESRKDVRIVRAMPIVSRSLGLYGRADIVEFRKTNQADLDKKTIKLNHKRGCYKPVPIEYKKGKPKSGDWDAVQLCAQVIALEEMLDVEINYAELYYGKTRHRERIVVDSALRIRVKQLALEMHTLYSDNITPKAVYSKSCKACSLIDICSPELTSGYKYVSNYYRQILMDQEDD